MTPDALLEGVVASKWLGRGQALKAEFVAGRPFPLVVLDGFLVPDLADELVHEFPGVNDMPRSRDYIFGNKHELSSLERSGPAGLSFHRAMTSASFERFLAAVTGWELFVDPAFLGGGFHQGGDGSFLDMHLDFNVHPLHPDWMRMLNILVYLNRDWEDDWGGHLLVKSSVDDEPRAIAPAFNRAVIMLTADSTYHGYRRIHPPPGVTRKSVATYAYRRFDAGSVAERTTTWVPEQAGALKRFTARHYNRVVRAKNRLIGNGTSRNR